MEVTQNQIRVVKIKREGGKKLDNEITENKTQKTNFTQVPNEILNNTELSWGAKGLWAYMAGKPVGWKFTIRLMASQCKDSVTSTTNKLNELLDLGYVKRHIVMTKDGKKTFYSIFEEPNTGFPNLEKPNLEKPNLENRTLEYSNTNISNKELSNKEKKIVSKETKGIPQNSKNQLKEKGNEKELWEQEFDELWQLYPRKESKADGLKFYLKARKKGVTKEQILAGIQLYKQKIEREHTERQFIIKGGNWFKGERWDDEIEIEKATKIATHLDFS